MTRDASRLGAQAISHCWTERQSALLQVIRNSGGITRQDLAVILEWPISSVCSVLDSVREQLEECGKDLKTWADGSVTSRTMYRIRR